MRWVWAAPLSLILIYSTNGSSYFITVLRHEDVFSRKASRMMCCPVHSERSRLLRTHKTPWLDALSDLTYSRHLGMMVLRFAPYPNAVM